MKFTEMAVNLQPSALGALTALGGKPDVYNFASGLPARELFPIKEMMEVDKKIFETDGMSAVQYSSSDGYDPLRAQIAKRMKTSFGVDCEAKDLIITTGSQQALSIMGQIFVEKGDAVLVESPTYLGALNALECQMPTFVEVPTDEDGMIPEELEKILEERDDIKMIYVIPDFQNPTGVSWSTERRQALVDLSAKYDIPVLEDAPYAELRFDGENRPSLKSLDKTGNIIFMGSFSKIMMPGLRVGWLVANPEILGYASAVKSRVDLQSSTFSQYQVSYFIDMFDLDAHVAEIKKLYRSRRDVICEAIKEYFPEGTTATHPEGGLFVWATLPEQIDTEALVPEMIEKNVAYVQGTPFYPNGGHKNQCRLNFSSMPEERIREGIKILGDAFKEKL